MKLGFGRSRFDLLSLSTGVVKLNYKTIYNGFRSLRILSKLVKNKVKELVVELIFGRKSLF